MARKLVAGLMVVALGLTWATRADAAGVTTHTWMAQAAIPRVSDPDLRALLLANYRQVEAGAHFPDSGYGNPAAHPAIVATYGEDAHWPRFSNAYADQIAADPSCGDLTNPHGPCAPRIAHLMGALAHGMGDEVWDWLFEPQAPDHGESYIPPALSGSFGTGGIEFQMDMIAIKDYGRPTSPALPRWPNPSRILGVFASIGRSDITATDLHNGEHSMDIVRAGERLLADHVPNGNPPGQTFHDDMVANMPWTSSHIVTAPGGIRFASKAIAAAWDSLWSRMLGDQAPTEVSVTYPADGQADVPTTGWDRASFQPGSSANRGGASNRIVAVLSASVPYQALPGSQSNQIPAGAMTLTEAQTGTPVPLRSGYPQVVPYNSEAGEHELDIQPDTNLAPCTEYEVNVTNSMLDENHDPVVPHSWTFTTDGCPGTVVRPDAQIRYADTGAFVGSDVYNATAASQARSATQARGSSVTFDVEVENDGNAADQFTITGQPAAPGFKVQYFDGATNVTAPVKAGTYQTANLAPGETKLLQVVLTVKANVLAHAKVTRVVTATSVADPSVVDAVKATVRQGTPAESTQAATTSLLTTELGQAPTPELLSTMVSALVCSLG